MLILVPFGADHDLHAPAGGYVLLEVLTMAMASVLFIFQLPAMIGLRVGFKLTPPPFKKVSQTTNLYKTNVILISFPLWVGINSCSSTPLR